ncbi:MAG: UPF0716 protein FxsA [Kiritimatiellia bacterium]|jgi:UPF0716 protein FxsA
MAFIFFVIIFIGMPLAELSFLLKASDAIGLWRTLALCIFTGVLGASLAKWQGAQTLRLIQKDLATGQMPAKRLIDGAMILCAGAVLLTPGFITDAIGFLLLLPMTRPIFREPLKRWLVKKMKSGTINVNVNVNGQTFTEQRTDEQDYIDVDEVK